MLISRRSRAPRTCLSGPPGVNARVFPETGCTIDMSANRTTGAHKRTEWATECESQDYFLPGRSKKCGMKKDFHRDSKVLNLGVTASFSLSQKVLLECLSKYFFSRFYNGTAVVPHSKWHWDLGVLEPSSILRHCAQSIGLSSGGIWER